MGGDCADDRPQPNVPVSIHATRVGGDVTYQSMVLPLEGFYPRHPCGWRRVCSDLCTARRSFYPRHPCGWRQQARHVRKGDIKFLSTPPVWVATRCGNYRRRDPGRFYPRHPCGWRPVVCGRSAGDTQGFYPRHPCGWRLRSSFTLSTPSAFLSTPPVWVATIHSS